MIPAQSGAATAPPSTGEARAHGTDTEPDPRRWLALAVIAVAQLMVVLDGSIVTLALPHAQAALDISTADRQWVMTAYTLAFGGLLLLGGRIADFAGRKRAFIWGLVGFAGASALGGFTPNAEGLFAARALQGACAAVLAPAALSLITVTFTDGKERARAFGVYGGISGGGAAIGLIVGGLLTEYASWRWCLFVNVPIALVTAVAAISVVRESRAEGKPSYDIPGAATITLGLVALVYGFTRAADDGWGAPVTVSLLVAAVVLVVAFVVIELRTKAPLLPMRVVLDRNRGGAFLSSLFFGAALLAMFLFMTFYFQQTLHYSALRSGFAFLPFSAGIVVGAGMASQLLPRFGPKLLMVVGSALAVVGLLLLTQVGLDTGYASHVLPAEILISFGMGLAFVPMSSVSLIGVAEHDAGVASALANTTQQVGGSLGIALLNTVYATVVTNYLGDHGFGPAAEAQSQIEGYTVSFAWSAGLMAVALVVVLILVRAKKSDVAATGAPVHVG
ncbi:MFS transporter [Frankia sp. CNm7]|uniref:MFS transporter n=2 Tax=Frankia nepalensis TaxID=1836974 RepID=A0A937RN90_9ACTN|nr:MFS transporter [Frankia nepalensis]MBL7509401.1 MFS transporter [Frankia nepalensis]MBL7522854.1 MFS transporter [Frankia nepalensis]MBL7631894.1 MFS transporter [Frankia nepalensis]